MQTYTPSGGLSPASGASAFLEPATRPSVSRGYSRAILNLDAEVRATREASRKLG